VSATVPSAEAVSAAAPTIRFLRWAKVLDRIAKVLLALSFVAAFFPGLLFFFLSIIIRASRSPRGLRSLSRSRQQASGCSSVPTRRGKGSSKSMDGGGHSDAGLLVHVRMDSSGHKHEAHVTVLALGLENLRG